MPRLRRNTKKPPRARSKTTPGTTAGPATATDENVGGLPPPVQWLRLADVLPAPNNRQIDGVADLVPSVRELGVLQPIRVRPVAAGFEIVYGHRRHRAAIEAGLEQIPAIVESMTDGEAQQARIVENLCREDPHPLDEAEAYESLLAVRTPRGKPLHDPKSLAALVGRSTFFIAGRLKLTALGPEMRAAFRAGRFTAPGALAIARAVPRDLQAEALAALDPNPDDEPDEPVDTYQVERYVEAHYLLRLARAVWPLDDTTLGAGACADCRLRVGAQPDLFGETLPLTEDRCTDALCYRRKMAAICQRVADAAIESGGKVLSLKESQALFYGGCDLYPTVPYVVADAPCPRDPEGRTWGELIGDACPRHCATDGFGRPRLLLDRADAERCLVAAGVTVSPDNGAGPPEGAARFGAYDPGAAQRAAELRSHVVPALLATFVGRIEDGSVDLGALVLPMVDVLLTSNSDAIRAIARRRRLAVGAGSSPAEAVEELRDELAPDTKRLAGLMVELALSRHVYFSYDTALAPMFQRALERAGIDVAAVEAATRARLDAETQAKAQAKTERNAMRTGGAEPAAS